MGLCSELWGTCAVLLPLVVGTSVANYTTSHYMPRQTGAGLAHCMLRGLRECVLPCVVPRLQQVLEGGMCFFAAARPPFVVAEASDHMMERASGRPTAVFLAKVSGGVARGM